MLWNFARHCCCRLKRLQYSLNLFFNQPTNSVLLTDFKQMNQLTKLSLDIFYPDSHFSALHVLGTYTKGTYLKTIISILISAEGVRIAWLNFIALPSFISSTSEEDFQGSNALRACEVYRVSMTDVIVLPAIEWQLVTMEIMIILLIWTGEKACKNLTGLAAHYTDRKVLRIFCDKFIGADADFGLLPSLQNCRLCCGMIRQPIASPSLRDLRIQCKVCEDMLPDICPLQLGQLPSLRLLRIACSREYYSLTSDPECLKWNCKVSYQARVWYTKSLQIMLWDDLTTYCLDSSLGNAWSIVARLSLDLAVAGMSCMLL